MQNIKRTFVFIISLLISSCFFTPKVSNPVIKPDSGAVEVDTPASISCSNSSAIIYYTTDGSEPDENSRIYQSPITINTNMTIKARAFINNSRKKYDPSDVVIASYTITGNRVSAPSFSPEGGSFSSAQLVTLQSTTSGATIRYTDDGSNPSCSTGNLYTTAINIASTKTISAIACKTGMTDSNINTETYTISSGGAYYLAGSFISIGTATTHFLARTDENGIIDKSFTLNSDLALDSFLWSIDIQEDNKIVLAGDFTNYNGTTSNKIARLNDNGTLDSSFSTNTGTGFDGGFLKSVHIQSDNKILVCGNFISFNGTSTNNIARLNEDGTLDTTFAANIGSGLNDECATIKQQNNGKIVAGGSFTSFNGNSVGRIIRLNSDGTPDMVFLLNSGLGFSGQVNTTETQSDGKIIIGGSFTDYDVYTTNNIARINTDGSLDTTFTTNTGTGFDVGVSSVKIQADGKILVAGGFAEYNGTRTSNIARINTDGTIDASFVSNAGDLFTGGVYNIGLQTDNKILVAGEFTGLNNLNINRITRLNSNGTLDTDFNSNTSSGFDNAVFYLRQTSNGDILIAGYFNKYYGGLSQGMTKLDTNGKKINVQGRFFDDNVNSIVKQSDGKLLAGGIFSSYNGISVNSITRLNSDLTLDTSFVNNVGAGFNGNIFALALQENGKILVGGDFTEFKGTSSNRLARLNSDGSLDNTFTQNIGSGANNEVFSIVIQEDGKILAGGAFNSFNGNVSGKIVRLNSDGTIDTTFVNEVGSAFNENVLCVHLQNDGKILVGGVFTSFKGTSRNYIIRLNSDGTLDTSFASTGFNQAVLKIQEQNDGKILVGGTFTQYGLIETNYLVRLNSSGIIDNAFNIGTGFDDAITAIKIQDDNKIVIGGYFTSYNSLPVTFIIRLNEDGSRDTSFDTFTSSPDNGVESIIIE